MKNELQGNEQSWEAEIYLDSLKTTLSIVVNWKATHYDWLHGF